jgi:uncharacterized membrane-anchored protein YhcB (DUF1043 family)
MSDWKDDVRDLREQMARDYQDMMTGFAAQRDGLDEVKKGLDQNRRGLDQTQQAVKNYHATTDRLLNRLLSGQDQQDTHLGQHDDTLADHEARIQALERKVS